MAMKLWMLTPKDPQEPPFHFSGVPAVVMVVADNEAQARHMAAEWNVQSVMGQDGSAWENDAMSDCVPFQPREAGVVASA